MSLQNKVALVTGASRGIGHAILERLVKEGATVIGTATSKAGADKITQAIAAMNGQGVGMVVNMGEAQSIEALMEAIKEQYKGVDILVNNAGITRDNLMMRMKDEEWDDVINTNLTGIFRLTKGCIRHMVKSRWGRVINISSVSGLMGNPGQCNYAAAKAGLIGFTKSLAREVASRGITANAVAPGYIATDMVDALDETLKNAVVDHIPAARFGQPKEIAAVVNFLAQDDAGYVTGCVINASGGLYM